ncbi:MAG: tetratricopeptide repeat protein, partial [Phycisphaeraceae bacterium]
APGGMAGLLTGRGLDAARVRAAIDELRAGRTVDSPEADGADVEGALAKYARDLTADAEAGEVQRGAARLTQFIERGSASPYYQQALLRRAHLYETHGELAPAADDYRAYLDSVETPNATSLQAGFRLMELLGALAKHDQIVALATGVLQLRDAALRTPEVEQEALYRLAVAQRFSGDLDKALQTHGRLTRDHPINPYRAESILEQGLIRMTQGDHDRGVPLLLDAIEREGLAKPSKLSAARIVAQHYADTGRDRSAYEMRARMQQDFADRDQILTADESVWMAAYLLDQGKSERAEGFAAGAWDGAVKERAMLLTGRAQRMNGKLDEAMQTLTEVRAISERFSVDAWLEIALVYRDQDKYEEALRELSALQDPDRGHRIASRALYEAGQIQRWLYNSAAGRGDAGAAEAHRKAAREHFKKLWLLYPDRAGENLAKRGYLELARLLHDTDDALGEIKTLNELTTAYPDSPYATLAKAILALRANRLERADSYLRQTIEQADAAGVYDLERRAEELLRRER